MTFGQDEKVVIKITKQQGVFVANVQPPYLFYRIVRPTLLELEQELQRVMPSYRIQNYKEYTKLLTAKTPPPPLSTYDRLLAKGIPVQKHVVAGKVPFTLLSFPDGAANCYVLPDFEDLQNSPAVLLTPQEKVDLPKIYLQLKAQQHRD